MILFLIDYLSVVLYDKKNFFDVQIVTTITIVSNNGLIFGLLENKPLSAH